MEGWLEIRKMALAPWAADILNFRYMFFGKSILVGITKSTAVFDV